VSALSRTRQTIVLIDDDESVRRALQRLLRAAGWHVETFAAAEQFLDSLAQPAPACLVVDVHLPGLSGLELHQRLQAEGRAVPVVFISAFGDERMRAQAREAGAIAFLDKPFQEECLLEAVAQAAAGTEC